LFNEDVREKIEKAKNHQLPNDEYMRLFEDVAKVSIQLYSPEPGQYVVIQLTDSQIVAAAKNKYDLVKNVRSRTFPSPLFIWKVDKK